MKRKSRSLENVFRIILAFVSLSYILPFLLLIISSLTDNSTLQLYGYSFFPKKFSLSAYDYLWTQRAMVLQSYGISIFNTAVGTSVSLILTALLAYPLSRKDFPLHQGLTFIVFFTLLFNGGLVPTYMIYVQIFHIKNTLLAYLFPSLLMNGFNVLLMRTFFATNIPMAVIESAKIDGAGEIRTFTSIVLPLSLPILATIGLLVGVGYWNDWYNGLIYITDVRLYSIQNLLNMILQDIQALATNAALAGRAGTNISQIPTVSVRMAIAVIGTIPILVIYPFFQKYFEKGITIGAVKG